jgi:hypothetical protein
MNKVLILNQSTLHPKYEEIEKLARSTWASINNPNVKIIHYYGKYDSSYNVTQKFEILPDDGKCILVDNELIIGTYDDTYPINHDRRKINHDARNEKFILALEYCINNFQFDYILRISNTSYIDITKMYNYISTLPKDKIYSGARNMYNNEIYFVAGHNVFMSYDVVKLLVNHKEEYLKSKYPADLATGKLLMYDLDYTSFDYQDSVTPYNTTHCDVVSMDPSLIKLHDLDSIFSYRIQSNINMFNAIHELVLERDIY